MTDLDRLMSTGEEVRLVTRAHWITIFIPVAVYLVLVLALVGVAALALGSGAGWGAPAGAGSFLIAIVPAVLLAITVMRWQAQQYVVTTRRVMQISGVLNKRTSDSNLDKVNDVVLEQSMFGRMLNYGDVETITGSDVGVDVFRRIKDPVGFKRVMLDNKEDFDSLLRIAQDGMAKAEDIPAQIERLAELRDKGVIGAEEFEAKKADLLARM